MNVPGKTQRKCRPEGGTHNSVSRLGPVSYCLWLFHKLFWKENDVFSTLHPAYFNFLMSISNQVRYDTQLELGNW